MYSIVAILRFFYLLFCLIEFSFQKRVLHLFYLHSQHFYYIRYIFLHSLLIPRENVLLLYEWLRHLLRLQKHKYAEYTIRKMLARNWFRHWLSLLSERKSHGRVDLLTRDKKQNNLQENFSQTLNEYPNLLIRCGKKKLKSLEEICFKLSILNRHVSLKLWFFINLIKLRLV